MNKIKIIIIALIALIILLLVRERDAALKLAGDNLNMVTHCLNLLETPHVPKPNYNLPINQ